MESGWLHNQADQNAGIWLQLALPDKVRIEFDARSEAFGDGRFPGDLKCEVFGEEPEHQSGYILIFGGWNNSISCIARKNEHGQDRLEETATRVERGRPYHWAVVRTDETLRWFLDGKLFLSFEDAQPVRGRNFGFNNWASNAYFDNLRIFEL